MRLLIALFGTVLAASLALAQDPGSGRKVFESRCAPCHGGDGNGGDMGPPIALRLASRDSQQLTSLIREGLPERGMPPNPVTEPEMANLARYLRVIQARAMERLPVRRQVQTTTGKTLDGLVMGEGFEELQLRTDAKRVHLLRREGARFREVTSDRDWPTYNGDPGGNRYTALAQIKKENISRLAPKWVFAFPNTGRLEATPVVVDGIMYVS